MNDGGGCRDTDKGMKSILAQIVALNKFAIKAGIFEDAGSVDGVPIAEYAAYNEYGVPGPPFSENGGGQWFIPPRSFIRGYVENNREKIISWKEYYFKLVSEGKMTAEEAAKKLGQNAKEGIKHFIKAADFVPNAQSTIRQKHGTNRPLTDTGLMRDAVDYKVENI